MFSAKITVLINLLIILFLKNVQNVPLVLPNRGENKNFVSREQMCFMEGKVLYEYNCYDLNTQGPCSENEFLVLDTESAARINPIFQAICKEKSCRNDDIYWAEDNYCYTPESSQKLCQIEGTSAQLNVFGDGHCDCVKSPPHARMPNEKFDSPCYPLFTRANCPEQHILIESNNLKTACIFNPCSVLGMNYIRWKDDRCHKLGSQGPCKNKEIFEVLDSTRRPGCRSSSSPLFAIDIPVNCKLDHAGECASEFSVVRGDNFRSQLLRSAERARKRKKKNC